MLFPLSAATQALQGDPRDPQAVARAAQRLQQGSCSGGGVAAPVNLHNGSDSARVLLRGKHRGGGEAGLMDGATHEDHTPHGVSPFRLAPFRRVPARRDLHRTRGAKTGPQWHGARVPAGWPRWAESPGDQPFAVQAPPPLACGHGGPPQPRNP